MAKKIGFFFLLGFAAIGLLAILAFLIFQKAWPLIPGLLALAVLAYPKARQLYRYITDRDE